MSEPSPSTSQPILPPGPLLLISLKLYFTPDRTIAYLHSLLPLAQRTHQLLRPKASAPQPQTITFALLPDFLTLWPCAEILRNSASPDKRQNQGQGQGEGETHDAPLLLGAQDCFWEPHGAYTGEVSPLSIKTLGASIVELGHAERRKLFGETDAHVAKKAVAAVQSGLIPLICVGEVSPPGAVASESVGRALGGIKPQVLSVLEAMDKGATVIFAYEPVWAIGAAKPAGVEHVGGVVGGIRGLVDGFGRTGETRIVYGGSAGPGLWGGDEGLRKRGGGLDGMFLGRFAHDIKGVERIVGEVVESL
jgi:triosephosphate isomerase (TIM)